MTETQTYSIEEADKAWLIDHTDTAKDFSNNDKIEIENTIKELDELAKEWWTIDWKPIKTTEYYKSLINSLEKINNNKKEQKEQIIEETIEEKTTFKEKENIWETFIVWDNWELIPENDWTVIADSEEEPEPLTPQPWDQVTSVWKRFWKR